MKKIINKILYPHNAFILIVTPISIAFLVYSLIYLGNNSVFSYISYILSFYCLLVICLKTPKMIRFFKAVKNNNKFLNRFTSDIHFKMNLTLNLSLIINTAYAIFQLGLGFYHNSLWFYFMFAYYVLLAFMRMFLLRHTKLYKPQEQLKLELKKSKICGYILLLMNLVLSAIIIFIVYLNKTFIHHEITTITIAAYTFTSLTFAIINFIKYKKYDSPVYNAAKTITLISACVSMITLTTTMLTTFGNSDELFRQIILAFTGGIVNMFVLYLAIMMIINSTKQKKK